MTTCHPHSQLGSPSARVRPGAAWPEAELAHAVAHWRIHDVLELLAALGIELLCSAADAQLGAPRGPGQHRLAAPGPSGRLEEGSVGTVTAYQDARLDGLPPLKAI